MYTRVLLSFSADSNSNQLMCVDNEQLNYSVRSRSEKVCKIFLRVTVILSGEATG